MNTVLYISFKVNVKPHVVHPDRQVHFKIFFFFSKISVFFTSGIHSFLR